MVAPLRRQEVPGPDLPHFSETFSWRMITTLVWTVLLACTAGGLWWYGQSVSEHFLGDESLELIWRRAVPIMLLVGPMALIMLGGGLDLSVGAVLGLSSVVTASALADGQSPQDAFLLAMLFSGGIGLLHALLVGVASFHPIVLTLVTAPLIQSAAMVYSNGQQNVLVAQDHGSLDFLPDTVMLVIVSAVVSLVLIQLAQIGGGSRGVPARRQRWHRRTLFISLPYVLSSLAAGFAGSSTVGRLHIGSPGAGGQMTLTVIFAALIGGNCTGRRFGTVIGAIAAVVILAAGEHLMIMEAVSPSYTALFIAASAGVALLLSELVYWIANIFYRNSRPIPGA
ncbi:MAG: hypothetical protein ISS69_14650 [Phycisphaerae bacterium]|nr:hypothetical protein [Phycisphaerae bacterium]